jgi:hypothetical protein
MCVSSAFPHCMAGLFSLWYILMKKKFLFFNEATFTRFPPTPILCSVYCTFRILKL